MRQSLRGGPHAITKQIEEKAKAIVFALSDCTNMTPDQVRGSLSTTTNIAMREKARQGVKVVWYFEVTLSQQMRAAVLANM